jgi:hypothetical protein
MAGSLTFANQKYFRPFDNTDNECCWQIDEVARDIDRVLAKAGIQAEVLYDDWGVAWSWSTDRIEHSLQTVCTDVDRAEYRIDYFALRRKWWLFKVDVPDSKSDFEALVPRLQQLNSGSASPPDYPPEPTS